jgi:DNA invertase Pin-like site-specific DNA recombinase
VSVARYGYARVSTRSRKDDSQFDALLTAGCERIWTDKVSGKRARRAEWDNLVASLRQGDELVITRLSRMARSVKLEAARARGRVGGRKPKLTQRQIRIARHTVSDIAESFDVSRKTIYRHLN